MLPYILSSILIFLLYLWYQKRKNHFSLFQKLRIPGPSPNIFFGNYLEIFLKGALQSQKEWISKHGKVLGYYYGLSPVLLVTDTDLLKNILIKDFQNFIDRSTLPDESPLTGRRTLQLFNLKGSRWKRMRCVITPSFTTSKMKMMAPIVSDAIDDLLENFEKLCENGKTFEVYNLFQKLTLDVVIRTSFGVQCQVQKNPKDPLYNLVYLQFNNPFRFFFLLIIKSFTFLQPLFRVFRLTIAMFIIKTINPLKELMSRCEAIIKARKENPKLRRPDLLQLMIDAKIKEDVNIDYQNLIADDTIEKEDQVKELKNDATNSRHLTLDEMVANATTILLAGYETTSTALAFCANMLVNFPEVQEKIRKELNAILEEGKKLDYNCIQNLQYLDQVFREVLRLYPPVNLFVDRQAKENIRYGNIFIPKGVTVQVPVFLLHHDPDYWEQPEEFRPERFAPEVANKINPLASQAFGAGPRNCVGMRFAQMEAKLVLAQILLKYRLLPTEKTDKYPFQLRENPVLLRPKHGVYIRLERC